MLLFIDKEMYLLHECHLNKYIEKYKQNYFCQLPNIVSPILLASPLLMLIDCDIVRVKYLHLYRTSYLL